MSATDTTTQERPISRRGPYAELFFALMRSGTFLTGFAIVLFWVICALFGEHFTPYDPLADDIINALSPPSAEHWFGTDQIGRDVFSRVIVGARDILTVAPLATLLAAIAIILDSQVLVIGAMVLGPEFGAIAALGVALVRRRYRLFGYALRTLVLGFLAAIVVTMLLALAARGLGWVSYANLTSARTETSFIYHPDKWSFIVAVIAAAAGVLSITSARLGGLSGVFISVTTVPAAGNVALGIAVGAWNEVSGSAEQLAINITGMALAGWLTLALQRALWSRVSIRRSRLGRRL